jgi:hypothetical protein
MAWTAGSSGMSVLPDDDVPAVSHRAAPDDRIQLCDIEDRCGKEP